MAILIFVLIRHLLIGIYLFKRIVFILLEIRSSQLQITDIQTYTNHHSVKYKRK